MKKIITIAVCLLSTILTAQCDSIPVQIGYSTSSHTFCSTGTYPLNAPFSSWVRINGEVADSLQFSVNGGASTLTNSIIFTPSQPGVTNFTLSGNVHYGTLTCKQTISWSFTTIVCESAYEVGINEYELNNNNNNNNNNIAPIYFDMYGSKTEPIKGVILIEQIGRFRKKVLFE